MTTDSSGARTPYRRIAHVYDLIYEAAGKDYAAESAELHKVIQERVPNATSLLDVACGTGGHLRFLQQWYEVAGADLDPAMIEQAQLHLPSVELLEADMRRFQFGRTFDAVVCLFSSIGYMQTEDDLATAISTMAAHLRPEGVLVLDGWVLPDAWRGTRSTHMETASDDSMRVARVGIARRELNKTYLEMHYLVGTVDGVDHVVDEHELTLFDRDQYVAALALAGIEQVEVMDSPMSGRDRYVGRKPA